MNPRTNRRDFLKAGSLLALPYFVPSTVLGAPGKPGANDKVHIGVIGLGGRATDLVKNAVLPVSDAWVVAVCDCLKSRCERFVQAVQPDAKWGMYDDLGAMFEKEKLDAVMVETTTHARAWTTVHAMLAGMDVYIEKPMALTIAEGREMVDVARKQNVVTQVGTQQRSMPINNWASDLVKNGALGKIRVVRAPNFIGPDKWGGGEAEPMPEGKPGWWDEWTNQAELRPYRQELHYGWSQWWAYDGGGRCFGVTGWGAHSYDQVQRALGTDETGPVEVTLMEPSKVENSGKFDNRKIADDETGSGYYGMANVIGPRGVVHMKYATGTELRLDLDGDRGPGLGCICIGEKGKLEINRNKLASNPKELVESPDNPGPITKNESQYHVEDWIACIKSRARCTADIEYGQRASTICYLVNIAREVGRVGEALKWDPATERFTNCDEGNKLLSRPRRKGYELPT